MKNNNLIPLIVPALLGISSAASSQGLQAGYFVQLQSADFHQHSIQNASVSSTSNGNIYTGITITYFASEKFGMGTGISYGRDGETFFIDEKINNIPVRSYSYNYIFSILKIPVHFKYHIKVKRVILMLEGGPQFGYLLKATNKSTFGTYNYSDDYAKIQVGFQGGFGVGFTLKNKLILYIRPNMEFTSMSFRYTTANEHGDFPIGRNLTSTAIGIQFGVIWQNKKSTTTTP